MAKNTLPTNFKDDILNASMNGKRRYNLIPNTDGTYSLEDASVYDQVGSDFGAAQVNMQNQSINESVDKSTIIDSLDDVLANKKAGMPVGALAVAELNSNLTPRIARLPATSTKIAMTKDWVNAGSDVASSSDEYYDIVSSTDDAYIRIKKPGTYMVYGRAVFQANVNGGSATGYVGIFADGNQIATATAYTYQAFYASPLAVAVLNVESPIKVELKVAKSDQPATLGMMGGDGLLCVKIG